MRIQLRSRYHLIRLLIVAAGIVALQSNGISYADEKTCYSCHEGARARFNRKYQHEPLVKENCEACHARHGFSNMLILKMDGKELCLSCHTTFDTLVAEGEHVHPAFTQGLCMTCHDPHSSESKGLVRNLDGAMVCFACHKNLNDTTRASHQHGPFAERDCSLCHVAHSGPLPRLLVSQQHELCGGCHEAQGTKNAHDDKGLTTTGLDCSGCHERRSITRPSNGMLTI